jgi:membrane-bound ClpP family serine protease
MWTPKQWWVAFPVLSAVMIMLGAVWIRTAASDTQWLVAITAGVIAGLFIAVGWMFRPLLVAVTILCMTAAIVVICAAEATADYGTLSTCRVCPSCPRGTSRSTL